MRNPVVFKYTGGGGLRIVHHMVLVTANYRLQAYGTSRVEMKPCGNVERDVAIFVEECVYVRADHEIY